MRNVLLSSLTTFPKGNKALASQLGYSFVVILTILIVISMTITTSYVCVLEQDRTNSLQTTAISSALAVSHKALQDGMEFPLPISMYSQNGHTKTYTINIYTKAGNSFLRVYTSMPAKGTAASQVTLDGAGAEYNMAFEQQQAVVVSRSDKLGSYVAGVAPIIGPEGTVSGLAEVLMPASDFHSTENGLSLSWVFTMISIAASLAIVYYEIHKLLSTIFGQPDRTLPKIIRYGMSGCQSIAFFSAMACSMVPLVISTFLLSSSISSQLPPLIPAGAAVVAASCLFAWGFFGFSSLRILFVRRFTTRISLIISVFAAFFLLILSSVFSNVYLFLVLLLPTGFLLGMVFYFQREYRIYASRLGYEDFSERAIHNTQYTGYLLGASVGAVLSGMIYERFGLFAVSLICGCLLLIVGIQALLFVQHCPASSSPRFQMSSFVYAVSSKKSGAFVWSAITTAGIQLSFYFVFLPGFLTRFGLSLATISFYFILFSFVGSVLVRTVLKLFPNRFNMQGRIMLSAIFQIAGFLLLSVMPTAKVLVFTVILFGAAMGLHDFRFLDYYKSMIREEKKGIAREILEHGFSLGAVLGAFIFSAVFLTEKISLPLIIFTLAFSILLLTYPLMSLMYTPDRHNTSAPSGNGSQPPDDGSQTDSSDPFKPLYGQNPDAGQPYGQPYYDPNDPYHLEGGS